MRIILRQVKSSTCNPLGGGKPFQFFKKRAKRGKDVLNKNTSDDGQNRTTTTGEKGPDGD